MDKDVKITVDGREIEAPAESPILPAIRRAGIEIPTLCHHEAVAPYGACRLCLVEVNQKGWDKDWYKLTTSCNFPALDGLTVRTHSERIDHHRRIVISLIMARAPQSRRVRQIAESLGVTSTPFRTQDEDCILCGLCSRVCEKLGHNAIALLSRGSSRYIDTPMNEPSSDCVGCGSCAEVCPTDCIPMTLHDGRRTIWNKQFDMLRCKICGTAHITVDQARFHLNKTGLDKSYFDLCDECSRRDIAQRFLEQVI